MAKPSDFQLGENGLSGADNSTDPSEKAIEQKQQREMSSSDGALKLPSNAGHFVEPEGLFDEKAGQTSQPDHDGQLNETDGSDDETSMGASGPQHLVGLDQLRDEDEQQPVEDEQLDEMEDTDESAPPDVMFIPTSPIALNRTGETKEAVAVSSAENQEIVDRLPLVWDLKYNYQPLSSPDSTRVLVLFPAENTADDLRCYMDEVRLHGAVDEKQGYTALSYVWGADKAFHMVWFGNHSLRIRPNLDSALRNLRRRDRSIRLWVDAVCIDQNDLLERNHQVQQMRDIFSAASETVIYLGPQDGGNTGHSAWNFLERHSSWALDENRDIDRNAAQRLDEHLIYFRGDLKDVELDVLSRSWFRRLWVFQEAVVSQSLSVQCGNRRISWDDFCEILLLSPRLHDRYGFSLQDNQKLDIVRDINISRREYLRQRGRERFLPAWQLPDTFGPSQGDMEILAILSRARYLEATDARDKIYGLVGISTGINTADPRFAIDYRLAHRDLYIRFARNHIEATKSYDILSYVDAATQSLIDFRLIQPSLPSWVPNWDYQKYTSYGSNRTILETLPAETPAEMKARQKRVADGYYGFSTQQKSRTMVVPGRIIGRIDRHTLPLRLVGMNEVHFQQLRNSTEDESQRFKSIMELWPQILYFEKFELNKNSERGVPLRSPAGGVISAVESPIRARIMASYFQEALIKDPSSVEYHLYTRARQTAGWSEGANKASHVITDKESIVDGKRLALCTMGTELAYQLALVPSMAHEGDYVVQVSGSRVPFIVKDTPGVAWLGEKVDASALSDTLKQTTCQIVGECLLNDFKELSEDKMDRMFVMV